MSFMPVLTLKKNNEIINIPFSGQPRLSDLLQKSGIDVFSPCGGNGKCGKCAVNLSGEVSSPTDKEIKLNTRLACQTVLLGDSTAELINCEETFAHIETDIGDVPYVKSIFKQYGAAIDVGTTTVALKLFSNKGELVAEESCLNPQRSLSHDVIGRINASLNGKSEYLQNSIIDCIKSLLSCACNRANINVESVETLVITGNTAMLYFLCGYNVESISKFPFNATELFGKWFAQPIKTYLPPCMDSFVGADITCAALASHMCESDKTALLCDIGTNGEIALWKNGALYVTSTAAGPAFEGGEISSGCGYTSGAIDKVWSKNGSVAAHTVDNASPKGFCGSGLIDAVSVFLDLGYIDASGGTASRLQINVNGGSASLSNDDIRALQLAKGAVRAGIETLLSRTNTSLDEIEVLYLAGGFGTNLNLTSAANIGLIPCELINRTQVLGNAALRGASMLLFDESLSVFAKEIANKSKHIELGGSEDFNKSFVDNLNFYF